MHIPKENLSNYYNKCIHKFSHYFYEYWILLFDVNIRPCDNCECIEQYVAHVWLMTSKKAHAYQIVNNVIYLVLVLHQDVLYSMYTFWSKSYITCCRIRFATVNTNWLILSGQVYYLLLWHLRYSRSSFG